MVDNSQHEIEGFYCQPSSNYNLPAFSSQQVVRMFQLQREAHFTAVKNPNVRRPAATMQIRQTAKYTMK